MKVSSCRRQHLLEHVIPSYLQLSSQLWMIRTNGDDGVKCGIVSESSYHYDFETFCYIEVGHCGIWLFRAEVTCRLGAYLLLLI